MAFSLLQIHNTALNNQKKKCELSLLYKAGNPVLTVSQETSAYNIIPLVTMKKILEEVAVVDGGSLWNAKFMVLKHPHKMYPSPSSLAIFWRVGR
jgi:hypothetical protein